MKKCVVLESWLASRQITPDQYSSIGKRLIVGGKGQKGATKKKEERERRSEGSAFYLDCDITVKVDRWTRWMLECMAVAMATGVHVCLLCVMSLGSELICRSGS